LENVTPLDRTSGSGSGSGRGSVTPNQLRYLLNNIRKEILLILRTNKITNNNNIENDVGTDTLAVLREELERIILIAQQKRDKITRHIELVRRLSISSSSDNNNEYEYDEFLWIEPDDARTIQQRLLPLANLVLPLITNVVEDAITLKLAISKSSPSSPTTNTNTTLITIPSELREDIIEMIWDDNDGTSTSTSSVRDFTSEELQINSKEAQSKYDLETFRRWKRAIKKKRRTKKLNKKG